MMRMQTRNCDVCGSPFETEGPRARYCTRCSAVVSSVTATLCNQGVKKGADRKALAVEIARKRLEKRGVQIGENVPKVPVVQWPEARKKRPPKPRKRTCACGATYSSDSNRQEHCPDCSCALKVIRSRIHARVRLGILPKERYGETVAEEYRKHCDYMRQKIEVENFHRCPYCGKRTPNKTKYCRNCTFYGYNHLHEEYGKTNGWDKKERQRVHASDGWRGQARMGGHATSLKDRTNK